MNRSFYQFTLSFRGGEKDDLKAVFAEAMFNDLSFPKEEKDFDPLSRYVEEKADPAMRSIIFDELYKLYEERYNHVNSSSLHKGLIECMIKQENLKVRQIQYEYTY